MLPNAVIVSVIIPAFNAAATIAATLESALNQTLREIELIVVDDGSTDGTQAVVESFMARNGRIRLMRQSNSGVGAARNAGIRIARGDYIAPLDADDTWLPDKLEQQVRRMEECGSATGLVYCASNRIDAHGKLLIEEMPCVVEGKVRRALILRNFIGNASVPLFRAEALRKVGLYLEKSGQDGVQGCEDWDLSIRIAEKFEVRAVPLNLVNYRQVPAAMSLNFKGMIKSFNFLLTRARRRNKDLPASIFRWSASNFYRYLTTKCYLWQNYKGCLRCIVSAILSDPASALNTKYYIMGGKSLFRLITGKTRKEPLNQNANPMIVTTKSTSKGNPAGKKFSPGNHLFQRISAHRWHEALKE